MSAVDWPAMLAQLEAQKAAAAQEIADIDAVMVTVRRRAGAAVPAGLQLPPARNGKHVGTKGRARHGRIADAEIAEMRKEFEAGTPAPAIAKKFNTTEGRVYYFSASRSWKRPAKNGSAKSAPAKTETAQPKGEKLPGSVRCTSCTVMTGYDPCEHCGQKLKRKW